jgi:hypothetical protein
MEVANDLLRITPSVEQLGRSIASIALLFMAALLTFCASLVDLARETRIALHENDFRA